MNKLVLGLAIGDGCLFYNGTKTTLVIRHSNHQLDYVHWKYNLDKKLWKNEPREYKNSNKGKIYYGHQIRTPLKKEYNEERKLLYPNGKKYISREVLDLLDEKLLAIWFMDDGCCDRPIGRNPMGIISTHCHSPEAEEELIIQKYFQDKWNIKVNINKGYCRYRLRFPNKEFCKFVEIIKPHVIPSLEYKINTTIRLSAPTKEKS